MKTYEFKLPDIGEGVTEGEIVKWLVTPGEVVREDQPMVEVMTDKATVTITSPKSGKILETRGDVGSVVPVHSVLVVFDLGAAGGDEAPAAHASHAARASHGSPGADQAANLTAAQAKHEPAATAVGDIKETLPGMNLVEVVASEHLNGHAAEAGYFNEKPLATPATRRLARELGVDLRTVAPSGSNGRVTKDDVKTAGSGPITTPAPPGRPGASDARPTPLVTPPLPLPPAVVGQHERATAPAPARALAHAPSPMKIASPVHAERALEERIPLRGVRKRIFEGMARSKHTAAHFTFVEECDVTALKDLRSRLRPTAEKAGVKLTFLPFFVKACVAALKKHPILNSAFDETTQEIVKRRYYNIGIASATEAGLIVPVVRDADRRSLLDVARGIARLGDETKAGKTKPEDLGNSTFTITSLGQQGGLFATPILNFPEVAILGVHQIKQKPVVRDGQIVIGEVMLISLSFDHRIVDGHVGAAFAYEIINYLQEPDRLFLEMA